MPPTEATSEFELVQTSSSIEPNTPFAENTIIEQSMAKKKEKKLAQARAESDVELDGASDLEDGDGEKAGECGALGGTMNLVKAMVGAGIVALPYAVKQTGWAVGMFTLFFAAILTCLGLMLLTRCAAWVGTRPTSYGKLCQRTWPRIAFIVDLAVLVSCFGGGVPFLVVIGDLLPKVAISFGAAADSYLATRIFWIGLLFVVIDIPLTCLRKIDKLSYTSGIGVISLIYVTLLVILFFFAPAPQLDPCYNSDLVGSSCRGEFEAVAGPMGFLKALPTFIFAFNAGFIVFSIYDSLKKPSAHAMEMGVVIPSVATATTIYGTFAFFGYFTYGSTVSANILAAYPSTYPVVTAQLLMSFVVAVTYPLYIHTARDAVRNLVNSALEATGRASRVTDSKVQNMIHWCSTAVLLGVSFMIAALVSDLGVVVSLIGILCSLPISYLMPGVFYCKVYGPEMRAQWDPNHVKTMEDKVLYWLGAFLVVFGVVFMPVALVVLFL